MQLHVKLSATAAVTRVATGERSAPEEAHVTDPAVPVPVQREPGGLMDDVRHYFLARPRERTALRFADRTVRTRYEHRILQRLGIHVADYAILNIHRIGIEAPAVLVWEELQEWGAGSGFWPDRIARIERRTDRLDEVRVSLLGRPPWTLFRLTLLRRQHVPRAGEIDNARFLLYRCSGGYPIGVLAIYVRTAIVEEGETAQTQVFFVVAFNFYGHDHLSQLRLLRAPWQWMHDRVTGNVLGRLKRRCEADYARLRRDGFSVPHDATTSAAPPPGRDATVGASRGPRP